MKKSVLALLCIVTFSAGTACGNTPQSKKADDQMADSPKEMVEKGFAFKMTIEGETYIYTQKGNSLRMDRINGSGHTVYIYVPGSGNERRDDMYFGDEGWVSERFRSEQTINSFFGNYIADNSELLCKNGYSKTGTVTVCGKVCDFYSGAYNGNTPLAIYGRLGKKNAKGEFAVWNGFTLQIKYYDEVMTECESIKVGIPDRAFDKSLDVSWAE